MAARKMLAEDVQTLRSNREVRPIGEVDFIVPKVRGYNCL
jgi:hypothetical protein